MMSVLLGLKEVKLKDKELANGSVERNSEMLIRKNEHMRRNLELELCAAMGEGRR